MPRNANAVAIDWLYAMRPSLSLIWIGATLLLIVGIKRYAQSSKTVTMKITRIFVHPIKVSVSLDIVHYASWVCRVAEERL